MARSYDISKQVVWRAYQRVKANKGAAGIDGQTIEDFEQDLKGNLYKIWSRLTSGSYLPPAVMAVTIPTADSPDCALFDLAGRAAIAKGIEEAFRGMRSGVASREK